MRAHILSVTCGVGSGCVLSKISDSTYIGEEERRVEVL